MEVQGMEADSGGSYKPLQLEPFIHQVGGHSSMLQLDADTICKPLIPQELNFYKTAPEALKEFTPEYKGVIEVRFSEADDGYLDFTTYLPPNYTTSSISSTDDLTTQSEKQVKHRIRLSQSGNIRIGSISLDDLKESEENKSHNGALPNPWVLQCHKAHMKKLPKTSSSFNQKYILLENRTSKYEFPCILDIKMGTRQYGDTMSVAKRQSHTAKAATSTSASLGVRLSGMQVYRQQSGDYICQNKYYGRRLNEDGFHKALLQFLHDGCSLRHGTTALVLERLHRLHAVVRSLDTFRFYTSSLLVIYDGSSDNGNRPPARRRSGGCAESRRSDAVDVCMIDFAHSTHECMPDCPVVHEGPDEGYLLGLKNLIRHLETIQQSEE